ncbi:MAG: hypothetical protein JRJ45_01860 [Deltaproteobacteria bacterium]|nr:hypothetical protein [Deltaproteobacteria bacterium]
MSFFVKCPKQGAIRQAHGPEQSRRTYVRSNPDFIGTVNVSGITKKDIHMLLLKLLGRVFGD